MSKTVAIIGVGLIGGSLGLALKRRRAADAWRVVGIGRDRRKLGRALRRGAVDGVSTDPAAGVRDADIVVVCTPVDTIAGVVREIAPFVRSGTVITDAGSVKASVVAGARKALAAAGRTADVAFVGGHPMAGIEKPGIDHADADLFHDATVVLTPGAGANGGAVQAVRRMWREAGGRILVMEPGEHDRAVAATSHAPHVISYALAAAVGSRSRRDGRVARVAAGSFRDMTRVAASDPRDWAAICAANGKETGRVLDDCIRRLVRMREALGDPAALERLFAEGRTARTGQRAARRR